MAALFRFNLVRLWLKTNPFSGEANWSHSVVVPLIGLYYLYIHREELFKARIEPVRVRDFTRNRVISALSVLGAGILIFLVGRFGPQFSYSDTVQIVGVATGVLGILVLGLNWALGSLLFGILFFLYGIWPGQNDYIKDLGMVITLFGLVLQLCGWEVMKIAWFPIAFLVCAIPWPGLVYSWVAGPLQKLAADVAVWTLNFVRVGAAASGTKIFITGKDGIRTLNVAEACAGMRSLMTFISVAAAVAFLSARPMWQKVVITLSAIPIAIFCNVVRVSGQGLLDHYWSEEISQGFAHAFVGTIMLIPGFFIILGVGWFIDRLFIEEVDEQVKQAEAAALRQQQWTRGQKEPEKAKAVEIPAKKREMVEPKVAEAPKVSAPVVPPQKRAAPAKAEAPPSPAPVIAPSPAPAAPKAVTPPRPAVTPPRPAVTPPRPTTLPPRPAMPGRNPATPKGPASATNAPAAPKRPAVTPPVPPPQAKPNSGGASTTEGNKR